MRIGFSFDEALDLPYGELLDYIAIEQIKNEGAKPKPTAADEEEAFLQLLKWG